MTSLHPFKAERVWLAPMSGSTDAAFRRQAVKWGAPAVVSEMVAGEALAAARPDMVRRTCRHDGEGLWIVQLAARRPEDMYKGAKLLVQAGVDVIDINMGCPARQVTGGNSGSALMREPELALQIVEAALEGAGGLPVTLKMRLGWDHDMLNAPEIAKAAQDMGVSMITVHGRTRCQFYKGSADWNAIHKTRDAISVPLIANGDIVCRQTADAALAQSGGHGVMIGRGAMGQPWILGQIASHLNDTPNQPPTLHEQCDSLCEQIEDSAALYGEYLGLRIVRKHIAAHIDKVELRLSGEERRNLRAQICQLDDISEVLTALGRLYAQDHLEVAA